MHKIQFRNPEAAFQAGKTTNPQHWQNLTTLSPHQSQVYAQNYLNPTVRPGWNPDSHMQTVVAARWEQSKNYKDTITDIVARIPKVTFVEAEAGSLTSILEADIDSEANRHLPLPHEGNLLGRTMDTLVESKNLRQLALAPSLSESHARTITPGLGR